MSRLQLWLETRPRSLLEPVVFLSFFKKASTSLATLLCIGKQTQKLDLFSQVVCPGVLVPMSLVLLCLMFFHHIPANSVFQSILWWARQRYIQIWRHCTHTYQWTTTYKKVGLEIPALFGRQKADLQSWTEMQTSPYHLANMVPSKNLPGKSHVKSIQPPIFYQLTKLLSVSCDLDWHGQTDFITITKFPWQIWVSEVVIQRWKVLQVQLFEQVSRRVVLLCCKNLPLF